MHDARSAEKQVRITLHGIAALNDSTLAGQLFRRVLKRIATAKKTAWVRLAALAAVWARGSSTKNNNFVVQYRGDFERGNTFVHAYLPTATSNQQSSGTPANALRQFDLHLDWPYRNQFLNRSAPRARARQIDKMQNQPPRLLIQMAIDQAGPFHRQRDACTTDPSDDLREKITMVGEMLLCIASIQVGRQKRNARLPLFG